MHPQPPEPKTHRSGLRTAAIAAGGAGVAYSGLKIGQAADSVRRALDETGHTIRDLRGHAARIATHGEEALKDAHAVAGGIRKAGSIVTSPFRRLRRLFKMNAVPSNRSTHFSIRNPQSAIRNLSVSEDKYRKLINEHEQNRAESNYARSALAGATLGGLLKGKFTRGKAALIGGATGIAAQGAVRAANKGGRDQFGDRNYNAKRAEKLPWQIGGAAAGLLAWRKVAAKAKGARSMLQSRGRVTRFDVTGAIDSAAGDVAGTLGKLLRSKRFVTGAALAGGITAADAATSAVNPQGDHSRVGAAAEGAGRGLLYGTVLAGAEPILHSGLRRTFKLPSLLAGAGSALKTVAASAETGAIAFRISQQLRDINNRFVDPLDVASGVSDAYHRDAKGRVQRTDLPATHAQVVRAALAKGQRIHRIGSRAGRLVGDAVDVAAGRRKTDSRGRPQKREWEKSWFRNAVGTAAVGAGLLAHAHVMRKNPVYRAKVQRIVKRGKDSANQVMPDLFPMSAKVRLEHRFDGSAPDWDVRDQRGRSARVFAPGTRPRERREKQWHEKVSNIRKLAMVGALAAAAGGTALGFRLGKGSAIPRPKSWQRPGYQTQKVTVVSRQRFKKEAD